MAIHATPFIETETNSQAIDPAANLTFDLHLSAKEREERSKVVLPYTDQQNLVGVTTGGTGQIFYQPDEMDSFDESDPDEDLDF